MERQIGEQFDFYDVKLEVVEKESNSCECCYFYGMKICRNFCIVDFTGYCGCALRSDGKYVYFKMVEP